MTSTESFEHSDRDPAAVACQVLTLEADAITAASTRVGNSVDRAADIVVGCRGNVIAAGLGKSGIVAQKVVATLRSIGVSALFLHPVEAIHGDLGVYSPGDVTLMFSKSGTTPELFRLLPMLREFRSPTIAVLGNVAVGLALEVDCVLDASVQREADLLNAAPTASTAVAMALGDALAATVMVKSGMTHERFLRFHPGGQLGKNLGRTVADVMHRDVSTVGLDRTMKDAVMALSYRPLGAVCVVEQDTLVGIITDGDVRRAIENEIDLRHARVLDVMKVDPICVAPEARLADALSIMEDRTSQISVLPVVGPGQKLVGLVRLHDVYQMSD